MENNTFEEEIHLKFYCEKCNYKCDFKAYYERHLKSGKHINGKITKVHTKERKERVKKTPNPTIHKCEKCECEYKFKSSGDSYRCITCLPK